MSKWVIGLLVSLLLATNGFWFYLALDHLSNQKYRQQEKYEAVNRAKALEDLCNKLAGGMQKNDAIRLLNDLSPDFEAYEKEGRLSTIWLSFRLDDQSNVMENEGCSM